MELDSLEYFKKLVLKKIDDMKKEVDFYETEIKVVNKLIEDLKNEKL